MIPRHNLLIQSSIFFPMKWPIKMSCLPHNLPPAEESVIIKVKCQKVLKVQHGKSKRRNVLWSIEIVITTSLIIPNIKICVNPSESL